MGLRVDRFLGRSAAAWIIAAEEVGSGENPEVTLMRFGDRHASFVDVGANAGRYARAAATLYKSVHVFEPIPELVETLRGILPRNCTVHPLALSDHKGGATFRIPFWDGKAHTELASLKLLDYPVGFKEISVAVDTLDNAGLQSIALIKIDVEGAEYDVLRGAVGTLERERPILIVEIESRHTRGATRPIFDLMDGLGYGAFVLDRRALRGIGGGRRRDRRRLAQILAGLVHLSRKRVSLLAIDEVVERIHRYGRSLNTSIVPHFVNNFIFLPRERVGQGCDIVDHLTELEPPTGEWITERVRSLPAFDENWYLKANPDVARSKMSAAEHYVVYGIMEGRSPTPP